MSALVPVITAGDDIDLRVKVYDVDGNLLDVSSWTIYARILDAEGAALTDAIQQSSGSTGADWAHGVVRAIFPAAKTANITAGDAQLELQRTDSGHRTTAALIPLIVQVVPA